jgi:hypothetical protein
MVRKNQNAAALSALGASKGGQARAARLDPEERSAIAREAALKRWGDANVPVATHSGSMQIGDREIACAVLAGGKRVLTQETFLTAIGRAGKAKGGTGSESGGMPPFLTATNLQAFISPELRELATPIPFRNDRGQRAWGFDARLLPQVCNVYIDAFEGEKILASQMGIVASCKKLQRGLSTVGIIALVDEATGFQEARARDELQKILEAYISPELMPWTKKFPDSFFEQIYKVQGWEFKPGTAKRTPHVGKLINKYIYEPLPPGVLDKMRELNPADERGQRRHKHHQYLTVDTGVESLDRQIIAVTTLLRAAENRREFEELFERVFPPKDGLQKRLPLVVATN